MAQIMIDDLLEQLSNADREQYFLVSPTKIDILLGAAAITKDDRVLEVGAGVGTVARHVPACRSLTVVEFDERLVDHLRETTPHANVIAGDALSLIDRLPFDVLLSNLPTEVTRQLLPKLPALSFRVAVISVGSVSDLNDLRPAFEVEELTTISGPDFRPAQPSTSHLVRLTPREQLRSNATSYDPGTTERDGAG
jgi:hypothetical protein